MLLAPALGARGAPLTQPAAVGGTARDARRLVSYGAWSKLLAGGLEFHPACAGRVFNRGACRHRSCRFGREERGTQMDSESLCECDKGHTRREFCSDSVDLGGKSKCLSLYLLLCLFPDFLPEYAGRPRRNPERTVGGREALPALAPHARSGTLPSGTRAFFGECAQPLGRCEL